nr:MaoC/PaaZ C-terminal domain-containing protein [Rhodococcus sp. 15-1154-1]
MDKHQAVERALRASVGVQWNSEVTWTEADAMLYALSIGAGSFDNMLQYTTENSSCGPLLVIPTFVSVLVSDRLTSLRDCVDLATVVHVQESVSVARVVPPAGVARVTGSVTAVDRRSSGWAVTVVTALDMSGAQGERLATVSSVMYLPHGDRPAADRKPESVPTKAELTLEPPQWIHVDKFATRADQALLYRLNGDRNPLHSDPVAARAAGFDGPILHGLCTLGIACVVLMNSWGNGNPAVVQKISARFTRPVVPGDALTVGSNDVDNTSLTFGVYGHENHAVLKHGSATFARGGSIDVQS